MSEAHMNRHERRRHERLNRKEKGNQRPMRAINGQVPILGEQGQFKLHQQISQGPFADTNTVAIRLPDGNVLVKTQGGMPLIHESALRIAQGLVAHAGLVTDDELEGFAAHCVKVGRAILVAGDLAMGGGGQPESAPEQAPTPEPTA